MSKELPKYIKDAMDKATPPDGTIAMPYLTPTPKDNIKEEHLGGDLFRISMDNSYMVATIVKADNGSLSFTVQDKKLESDYYLAKFNGYILCEIAPRLGATIKTQKK